MHEAGANGVDNSRTIGSRQNALLALASHTANVDAYRARSKGVQWSSQLLAECSGWLKCDKAKLKSTACKELTFWHVHVFLPEAWSDASFVDMKRPRPMTDAGRNPVVLWNLEEQPFSTAESRKRSSVHSG